MLSKENKNLKEKEKQAIKDSRKEYFRKIDELFKTEYKYSSRFERTHLMSDGKAYINVDLTHVDTPFSIYSYDTRIDSEIYSYIEQEAWYLRADIPLVVNFDDGGRYSDDMKEKIANAVVRHYTLDYEDKRQEITKNYIRATIILIVGLILLSTYIVSTIVLDKYGINYGFLEALCIVSWAFVWESTNRFFFDGAERRRDAFNAGQLALMEVTFGKPVLRPKKVSKRESQRIEKLK